MTGTIHYRSQGSWKSLSNMAVCGELLQVFKPKPGWYGIRSYTGNTADVTCESCLEWLAKQVEKRLAEGLCDH